MTALAILLSLALYLTKSAMTVEHPNAVKSSLNLPSNALTRWISAKTESVEKLVDELTPLAKCLADPAMFIVEAPNRHEVFNYRLSAEMVKDFRKKGCVDREFFIAAADLSIQLSVMQIEPKPVDINIKCPLLSKITFEK